MRGAAVRAAPPSAAGGNTLPFATVGRLWLVAAVALLAWQEVHRLVDTYGLVGGDSGEGSGISLPGWPLNNTWKDVLSGIRDRPKFNTSNPIVLEYASLLEDMTSVYTKIDGISSGMGSDGMVNNAMLHAMGEKAQFVSCAGHIRIVGGKVYFRYGAFVTIWYRLRRFNQCIKMLQDAVNWYDLKDIEVEFFFNTCDLPMSFDNELSTNGRSGYVVFSTQKAIGTLDIIVPDPLDLAPDYTPNPDTQVPWAKKKSKAFFRGASTNYELQEYSWRASPRFRLHRMSDLVPDLIDAKVMRWSHSTDTAIHLMEDDGITLGKRIGGSMKSAFKYEIGVDGGVGTCRTCGLLLSNQAMIRQASGFEQFFEPMLKPMVHYIPTEHHFQDLAGRVRWARSHDKEVKQMVRNANEVAQWACTWEGRTLYWAIALAKYATNVQSRTLKVKKPDELCGGKKPEAINEVQQYPNGNKMPLCGGKDEFEVQPPCMHFCMRGRIKEEKWVWLPASVLDSVDRLGPHQGDFEIGGNM
eukprot:TRINITY_DN3600_c0_g1_i1.p1 TRINITY_DN3600_c0_g1~~TRINITY_DN3600_c0_g1_i1.p1  ORF type:complete len:524 (-),score=75.32 TRINITY_DN3600_c0_g1_i1:624-2195(-)